MRISCAYVFAYGSAACNSTGLPMATYSYWTVKFSCDRMSCVFLDTGSCHMKRGHCYSTSCCMCGLILGWLPVFSAVLIGKGWSNVSRVVCPRAVACDALRLMLQGLRCVELSVRPYGGTVSTSVMYLPHLIDHHYSRSVVLFSVASWSHQLPISLEKVETAPSHILNCPSPFLRGGS